MIFDKKKCVVQIRRGRGMVNTPALKGIVEHLIVRPSNKEVVWDLKITDRDGDYIYEVENHTGRLDDKNGLPIGGNTPEQCTLIFQNVSNNCSFEVIFMIKEL